MNSQKMIRLSVIAALAGVYGSAFAGTTYDKGTNFIDQTYENVVGTQPSKHRGAVMAFYPTNADDVFNIRNCVFNNNTSGFVSQPANGDAINWSQGGAFVFNGGTINVENSTFTKNTAGQGGAISQSIAHQGCSECQKLYIHGKSGQCWWRNVHLAGCQHHGHAVRR